MTDASLLYPVFAQIALTIVLHTMMGRARIGSLKRGDVKLKDIALGQPAWTDRATKIGNSYHSQLQLPVIFYCLVAFVLITKSNSLALVVLAWSFVLLRIAHAYIHTTSNDINKRFPAYAAGGFVLVVMWLLFAARIVLGW
jgi:hypothetical protein